MSLLVPLALFGLLTIPAILLLHLLRSRRRQIPVSSFLLWRGLELRRRGGLPRTIPLTLTLLLQLLAAALLSLALARPVQSFLLDPPRQVVFILDTTTSMLAEDGPGGIRRFEAARQSIRETLDRLNPGDAFAVVSLNSAPAVLLSGQVGPEASPRDLDSLVAGATGADFPAALTLANGLLRPAVFQPRLVILTDAALLAPDIPLPPVAAAVEWRIFPPAPPQSQNLALLNVSAAPLPDGRHRLMARLVNFGRLPAETLLRLSLDGEVQDETAVRLAAGEETLRFWDLPSQAGTAAVEIVAPDALPLDNRAELWLSTPSARRVLLLSDMPDPLDRALQAQPDVALTVRALAPPDRSAAEFDLLVLDGLPPGLNAWPGPAVWLVSPPLDHPLLSASATRTGLRPAADTASPLVAGVDLSGVYFERVPQVDLPDWAEVDLWAAGPDETLTPLIFHGTVDGTRLVVWAFNPRQSNLPGRLALPLLTANTLAWLLTPAPPQSVLSGQPVLLDGASAVVLPGGRRVPVEHGLFRQTHQPGLYTVLNAQARPAGGFAVHAGSALESDLTRRLPVDTLNLTLRPAGGPSPETRYEEFWPWLVGAALLGIVVEGWLVWRK